MAQVKPKNIIVGAGHMYISSADNSTALLPTAPDPGDSYTVALDASAAWQYVGATQEGVEISYTPDYGEVEVDQLKDAAVLFNQGVNVSMNTNMAEATLKNLLVAWGQPSAALASDVFSIGVPSEEPIERTLAVVGRAPARLDDNDTPADATDDFYVRRERVYYARRVISIEGSNHTLRRTEATVFPVTFRLLPNPSFPGAEYGTIIDRDV